MALRKTGEIMAVDAKGNRHKIIKNTLTLKPSILSARVKK
jgi:hypothetical protein